MHDGPQSFHPVLSPSYAAEDPRFGDLDHFLFEQCVPSLFINRFISHPYRGRIGAFGEASLPS